LAAPSNLTPDKGNISRTNNFFARADRTVFESSVVIVRAGGCLGTGNLNIAQKFPIAYLSKIKAAGIVPFL
jgi:hypothetical protein